MPRINVNSLLFSFSFYFSLYYKFYKGVAPICIYAIGGYRRSMKSAICSNSMLKKTALVAITILVLALAVVGPTSSIKNASGKVGVISGIVRPTGSITCPDGTTISNTGTSINASEAGTGNYIIFGSSVNPASGDISKAQINNNNFHLFGIGAPICSSGSSEPTRITMQGECGGLSVITINYKAERARKRNPWHPGRMLERLHLVPFLHFLFVFIF